MKKISTATATPSAALDVDVVHVSFPVAIPTSAQIEAKSPAANPWNHEPNVLLWIGRGLPCAIARGPFGALCGYVGVLTDHPLHGVAYQYADRIEGVCVHGGLTFSDHYCPSCYWNAEIVLDEDGRRAIVSRSDLSEEDEEDQELSAVDERLWWFGFDCAHRGDMTPGASRASRDKNRLYRDLAYVREHCGNFAEVLACMAPTPSLTLQ